MADDDIVIAMPALLSSPLDKKANKPSKKKLQEEEIAALISLVASVTSETYSFLSSNDLFLLPSQALNLESCIKSTAVSISKLHSIVVPDNVSPRTLFPPSIPSPSSCSPRPSWFRRFLSGTTADSDLLWIQYFRVTRRSFTALLQSLSLHLGPTPDYSLAAALFRLAHAAPYKTVARRFGFDSSSSACRGFQRVVKAIIDHLSHLLRIPSEVAPIGERVSLPNCFGALGFHCFFTSKGTLIVQALVDFDGIFLDVSAGWPGTFSPDLILRHSKFFHRADREVLNGPPVDLSNGYSVRQYVIGDSCCPLVPWLITPFREADDVDHVCKEAFNSIHGKGMSVVEEAFARVSAQWRLLSGRWKEECLESFPYLIAAGCLLHNFLIQCGNPLPSDIAEFMQEQSFPEFSEETSDEGNAVRHALASHLSLVNQKG